MDDLGFLTQWVDPRVAATAIALTEWLKGQLPDRWQKGKRIRWIALAVVALCYAGLWLAEFSEEVRRAGIRLAAIVATYVLSKVGYEAVKKVGTEAPEVTSDVEAVVVSEPRVEGSDMPVIVPTSEPQTTLAYHPPTEPATQFGVRDVMKGT